jgi:hypothetical protein
MDALVQDSLPATLRTAGTKMRAGMNDRQKVKQVKIKLGLDIALTVAFAISLRPFLTGLAVHEWLGLALGGALVIHAIWHWKWVTGVTRRLLGELPLRTRIFYALDALLLVAFLTIIGTGVAMSGVVLPRTRLEGSTTIALWEVHNVSSYLTLFLMGVKLVLHRQWILNAIKHHLVRSGRAELAGGVESSTTRHFPKPVGANLAEARIGTRRGSQKGGVKVLD